MGETYHEMVVEGPLLLVRGYLAGILVARGMNPRLVLFANEVAVDSEGVFEQIAEWIHLHGNVSHLLIPQSVYSDVRHGLHQAVDLFGIRIRSDRTIRSASFHFQFATHTREDTEEIQGLLASHGDQVRLSDEYQLAARNPTDDSNGSFPVKARGTAVGGLGVILELHQKSADLRLLKVSRIHLQHADE